MTLAYPSSLCYGYGMPNPKNTEDKRITPGFLAQAGKGRPKGVPNKSTQLAKDAIAAVAEGLGGVDRMIAWAQEDEQNERVFWSSIYTKLIPVQLQHSGSIDWAAAADAARSRAAKADQ